MDISVLKQKYNQFTIVEKLIAINALVFVTVGLFAFLFKSSFFINWFALESSFSEAITEPWTVLSYAFFHVDLVHLFFNMLWLYFAGRFFLKVFSTKLFLNVYLLGAISGGFLFLVAYNLFPTLLSSVESLIGASAAVQAVLIFVCASFPDQEVSVFTFKLKLWHIGVFLVGYNCFGLFSYNTGGNIAHLGGALLGYVYAKQYAKGNDIGKGFEKVMDAIVGWFKKNKQPKMKTVHKTRKEKNTAHKTVYQKNKIQQDKINSILEKISKSGYDSLTKEEKAFLFQSEQ